jgi:hypothetical protein
MSAKIGTERLWVNPEPQPPPWEWEKSRLDFFAKLTPQQLRSLEPTPRKEWLAKESVEPSDHGPDHPHDLPEAKTVLGDWTRTWPTRAGKGPRAKPIPVGEPGTWIQELLTEVGISKARGAPLATVGQSVLARVRHPDLPAWVDSALCGWLVARYAMKSVDARGKGGGRGNMRQIGAERLAELLDNRPALAKEIRADAKRFADSAAVEVARLGAKTLADLANRVSGCKAAPRVVDLPPPHRRTPELQATIEEDQRLTWLDRRRRDEILTDFAEYSAARWHEPAPPTTMVHVERYGAAGPAVSVSEARGRPHRPSAAWVFEPEYGRALVEKQRLKLYERLDVEPRDSLGNAGCIWFEGPERLIAYTGCCNGVALYFEEVERPEVVAARERLRQEAREAAKIENKPSPGATSRSQKRLEGAQTAKVVPTGTNREGVIATYRGLSGDVASAP